MLKTHITHNKLYRWFRKLFWRCPPHMAVREWETGRFLSDDGAGTGKWEYNYHCLKCERSKKLVVYEPL